eukprot:Rhum_TRINITY_DN16747_c0_g1::Rhum_TRINITY_DN16747_c0_g1_i1::g.164242::m.164242/K05360/TXNDC12; protein-disulfide reductase (glutathione)
MMQKVLFVALAVVATAAAKKEGHGFGEDYDWFALADGLEEAKNTGKPLMILQHKSWCGMCKQLSGKFAASAEIQEAAKSFVLVNCHDDDAGCDDEKFSPDGGYIPRILFATSQGEVKNEIQAPDGNAQYKYFYHDPAQIAKGMTAALAALKAEEL